MRLKLAEAVVFKWKTPVLPGAGLLSRIGTTARYVKARLCQNRFCDRFAANVGVVAVTAFKIADEPRKHAR
jgi:hypothetical protein